MDKVQKFENTNHSNTFDNQMIDFGKDANQKFNFQK